MQRNWWQLGLEPQTARLSGEPQNKATGECATITLLWQLTRFLEHLHGLFLRSMAINLNYWWWYMSTYKECYWPSESFQVTLYCIHTLQGGKIAYELTSANESYGNAYRANELFKGEIIITFLYGTSISSVSCICRCSNFWEVIACKMNTHVIQLLVHCTCT